MWSIKRYLFTPWQTVRGTLQLSYIRTYITWIQNIVRMIVGCGISCKRYSECAKNTDLLQQKYYNDCISGIMNHPKIQQFQQESKSCVYLSIFLMIL